MAAAKSLPCDSVGRVLAHVRDGSERVSRVYGVPLGGIAEESGGNHRLTVVSLYFHTDSIERPLL